MAATQTIKTAEVDTADRTALILSDQWRDCTDQQRVFITEYLFGAEAGNTLAAAKVAYPKATEDSQKCMQYEVIRSQGVVAVLEFWKWRDERAQILELAKAQFKAAPVGSVAAKDLLAQIERLTIGAPKLGRRSKPADDAPTAKAEPQVPADALATWYHKGTGVVVGYRDKDGKDVQLT